MSCKHGNHVDACDLCDDENMAYNSGLMSAPDGFFLAPNFPTESMINRVLAEFHSLKMADVAEIYSLFHEQEYKA